MFSIKKNELTYFLAYSNPYSRNFYLFEMTHHPICRGMIPLNIALEMARVFFRGDCGDFGLLMSPGL